MPRIDINVTEVGELADINSTNETVLVPLLVKANAATPAITKEFEAKDTVGFINYYEKRVIEELESSETPGNGKIKDNSYFIIYNLLAAGLNVVVKPIEYAGESYLEDNLARHISDEITGANNAYEEFKSRNIFDIKFITTGAHANVLPPKQGTGVGGCYAKLAELAAHRGDCVAIIEFGSNCAPDYACGPDDTKLVDAIINLSLTSGANYCTAFYPWGQYNVSSVDSKRAPEENLYLPAGYGYLVALANSLQASNNDWLAIAGVDRGEIPGLINLKYYITQSFADLLLSDSAATLKSYVNPIMDIIGYGKKIWGNKTLKKITDNKTASYLQYLNVRILVCDICKQIYRSALAVTYEPNDNITWINFKNLVNKLLDTMAVNRGLDWYSWKRLDTTEKATIKAKLSLKPIEAVENFDIEVNLTPEGASTDETI